MCGLKTLAGVALAMMMGLPAQAQDPLVAMFAECTGRLSAQMEHQWLMAMPAETTQKQRAAMISLLEAVTPVEARRETLARRIEAKAAQWQLLTRATFNDDPDDAHWAMMRAERQIETCLSLVIS